jgi:hypothetical protein
MAMVLLLLFLKPTLKAMVLSAAVVSTLQEVLLLPCHAQHAY